MPNIQFSELDAIGKRAVFWIAEEAKTVSASVIASAVHIGEIWEAAAFMKQFQTGTPERTALVECHQHM